MCWELGNIKMGEHLNGDGVVQAMELWYILKPSGLSHAQARAIFEDEDTDGNGGLSEVECISKC